MCSMISVFIVTTEVIACRLLSMSFSSVQQKYNDLKKAAKTTKPEIALDLDDVTITDIFQEMHSLTATYLAAAPKRDLISKVDGKEYFSFTKGKKLSRPINKQIYSERSSDVSKLITCLRSKDSKDLTAAEISIACYTIAVSFCAIIDLEKDGDKKTPGTFFEYFIGHIVSRLLSCNPRKKVEVLNIEYRTSLPTDLIYDLGEKKPKFHVPVKTSTRERVIQVWAHQRVLDGVYGVGRFSGLLFSLAEVKLDRKKLEVVEICLPDQWRLYQMFVSQMTRVYYLDPPTPYLALASQFPKIEVKEIGDFFKECGDLG